MGRRLELVPESMSVKGHVLGPVYWIILNRPEKLNALNMGMWSSLIMELEKACNRNDTVVVALRGEGRAFCTGDDIYEMYAIKSVDEAERFFNTVWSAVKALMDCEKPVVAVVHGYAYGGCLELLLLIDIVVAVRDTRFAAPEIKLGLVPPLLASIGPCLIGRKAVSLALLGREFSAEEAYMLGLVDMVATSLDEAISLARKIGEELAKSDPETVRTVLTITRRRKINCLDEGGIEALKHLVLKPSSKEKMRAFLEKKVRNK